ncbi:MAG TPA: transposase family protein [Anaerolineae bacterium]|jgi:hypothetical protein|nr:transposase family protein [Anaerolineae bacterium]
MRQPDAKYLAALRKRYTTARKKERGQILNEFTQTTSYNRKYAIAVLGSPVTRRIQPLQRRRSPEYTAEDARALEKLSTLFDGINAKLLRAALNNELKHLYDAGFLQISAACYQRLKRVSPATIDRLRTRYRRGLPPRVKRGHTKPGTLLKSQIRVRTWAEWNEDRPGFTEMDLVAHDGGDASGDFAQTLDFTDIKTGWTECAAAPNKAQKHVFAALEQVRARLPFPLLGIDSDNGAEFINDELIRYADHEHLTFTRSRPGRKNDGAHVEQKNWSVVRRFVGDLRYDTPAQVALLNQLYARLHLYINFFLPVVKLKEKIRHGSKVTKKYDEPQTPYQRVLASPAISPKIKTKLRAHYASLDVVRLHPEIEQLVKRLWASGRRLA